MQTKRYLEAAQTLVNAVAALDQDDLLAIGALTDLRRQLKEKKTVCIAPVTIKADSEAISRDGD